MRFRAETGIDLEGEVELRQKWYSSNAKPRTYAAMGGTSYKHCRHLQDFFTRLTNCLPSTNHLLRLRPGRLYVPPLDSDASYRIYDLSSFTSNMAEQKGFCESLAEFMSGVTVYLVDECDGVVERDLGELLNEYNIHCVFNPMVSIERAPRELHPSSPIFSHGTASLLGIFGNLMTCTVAHYLLIAHVTDGFDEDNTAGDDGLVMEHDYSSYFIDKAVSLIGDWEPEKCFNSKEPGAIALKRPLHQTTSELELKINVVPPTLVTAVTFLLGRDVDTRFTSYNLDELDLPSRFKIVGLDLLRCLRVLYRIQYPNFEMIASLYQGFKRLVRRTIHCDAEGFGVKHNVLWPVDPSKYSFYDSDPYEVWVSLNAGYQVVDERRHQDVYCMDLRVDGDVVVGNSSPRLVFLEKLGYIVKERVTRQLDQMESYHHLMNEFMHVRRAPVVYKYTCLKSLPEPLIFD